MIRATAAQGQIRAFALTGREMVENARLVHATAPVVTAALGRCLVAAAMMGTMMKGDEDRLTIHIQGTGPMRGLNVTADSHGNVKGYPFEPQIDIPANAQGKLDVGGAVGAGNLVVIKDLGLKDPYVGQTQIVSGEIAEDLTYYFANSEQIPTVTGLGVLVDTDWTVKHAGGFIIQLLPFASEETISKLEDAVSKFGSVTNYLNEGETPEQMMEHLLTDIVIEDRRTIQYKCNCDRKRVTKALISLGHTELIILAAEIAVKVNWLTVSDH